VDRDALGQPRCSAAGRVQGLDVDRLALVAGPTLGSGQQNRTTSSALSTTGSLRGSLADGIRSGISPWREVRAS
jgi:hypothetical protein